MSVGTLASCSILGKRQRQSNSECVSRLQIKAMELKTLKTAALEVSTNKLSLTDVRRLEKQAIKDVLKKMGSKLTSWHDVIVNALAYPAKQHFQRISSRGLFCDGFQIPTERFQSRNQLWQYLESFGLNIAHIAFQQSREHAFVLLDDEDHALTDIHSQLKNAFCSLGVKLLPSICKKLTL